MTADVTEMGRQASTLRNEAEVLVDLVATLHVQLGADVMAGPAGDRLRDRLVMRASDLRLAADDAIGAAAMLERAIEVMNAGGLRG